MTHPIERWITLIPILMFFEIIFTGLCLTVLFSFVGEDFNRLNNEGIGNALNAAGVVAAFYIIYGYGLIRLVSLGIALLIPGMRQLWLGCLGAITFGAYSLLFMRPITGPGAQIWVVWLLVVAFNFTLPLLLPKKLFSL